MEEIFDHLLVRVLFALVVCGIIWSTKYLHRVFYPEVNTSVSRVFNPLENSANTIHYLARIIGVSIVISALETHIYENLFYSLFNFTMWSLVASALYLLSVFIMEGILFNRFDYKIEILKKNNISYAVITAATSISIAQLINNNLKIAENSLTIVIILWLFCIVCFGLAGKCFYFFSHFSLKQQLNPKEMGIAISFSTYLLCVAILLSKSMVQREMEITNYFSNVLLNLLMIGIFIPIFYGGVKFAYLYKKKMTILLYDRQIQGNESISLGVTEGALFLLITMMVYVTIFGVNIYSFINH